MADVAGDADGVVMFAAERGCGGVFELVEVVRAEVGQVVTFRIRPQGFHGVEFRSVSREELDV